MDASAIRPTCPAHGEASSSPGRLGGIRIASWAALLALGAVYAWTGRNLVSPDSISYLDLGDAWLRGDTAMMFNAYWSPLYPVLVGLALRLLHPTPAWEYACVHGVNFLVYVGALACFEFLLREILRFRRERFAGEPPERRLSDAVTAALAYAVFGWTSLLLIGVWMSTPDLLVSAFFYLSAALMLRQARRPDGWAAAAVLGAVLGGGYFAKASLFPAAFAFLATALFAWGGRRRAPARTAVALLVFALVAALSVERGRLTFGDSGRLNFLWFNCDVRRPGVHWQSHPEYRVRAVHPIPVLVDSPEVLEFSEPFRATYALWYDPTYWHEGARLRLVPGRILASIYRQIRTYGHMALTGPQVGLTALLVVLCALHGRRWFSPPAGAWRYWPVLAPALAAMAMFLPVHVEFRHVGGFLAVFWVAVLAGVTLPTRPRVARTCVVLALVVAGALAVQMLAVSCRPVVPGARELAGGHSPAAHPTLDAAESLRKMGLRPGDRIAVLANAFEASVWARLLRVRITEQCDPDEFRAASPDRRGLVLDSIRGSGVRAVVLSGPLPDSFDGAWKEVDKTRLHAIIFADERQEALDPGKTGKP